jgi:hypothetical protein
VRPEHLALFLVRPLLTSSPCLHCLGSGRSRKGGSYWLAPDESAPEVPGEVAALPIASCTIFEAAREASQIARHGDVVVTFRFNNQDVIVRQDSDPDLVARRWWITEYGKTPEESMAER